MALVQAVATVAHPRSRGENGRHSIPIVRALGSSPLTRGKRNRPRRRRERERLIPAHAGKTLIAAAQRDSRRAHPRSRGENSRLVDALLIWRGSSPLTRGKQALSEYGGFARGLIPAHAGKTR